MIKETLRIYPPMPVTIRRSLKDGMLGRYRIREGRHHPGRDARRAARPALLGTGPRPVRSGTVRDGEGCRPAAPRFHPVLDRQAAVHGARGHVHDAPRRAVRDLQALPAAPRAGRDRGEEHGRDDEAGRGSDHPAAARAPAPRGRRPRRASRRHRPRRPPRARRPGPLLAAAAREWGEPAEIPADERLPPSRDRLRQQLRREQGTGRALRRAQPLLRLHERRDHAERARGVAAARRSRGCSWS